LYFVITCLIFYTIVSGLFICLFVYYYYRFYQGLLWILSPWKQNLSPSSGIYSRDSLVIFMLFVEELPLMHPQQATELHHK
jgi:hypothetical protein